MGCIQSLCSSSQLVHMRLRAFCPEGFQSLVPAMFAKALAADSARIKKCVEHHTSAEDAGAGLCNVDLACQTIRYGDRNNPLSRFSPGLYKLRESCQARAITVIVKFQHTSFS